MRNGVTCLAAAVLVVTACRNPTQGCSRDPSPGIELAVRAADTGENVERAAVVTVVRLTPPRDSARGSLFPSGAQQNPLEVAFGRFGDYRVRVEVPGYQPWERTVTVPRSSDPCGDVDTVTLEARLTR